ncbi:hypothetical protein CMV_017994 [Castanea mollissima]|uniref:Mon2/Sec7/BIG1-like dimerisation and cyclophilin-binding domain-containing protein n=1 Tax=Castanea mollissima TaxID=60419 RepID=A0A8J4QPZ0_9ROSI|nr:hypothetical protein CMV_017994 [Castanea mollissima]
MYDEALDCIFKLFSLNLIKTEIEHPDPNSNFDSNSNIVYKIIDLVCKSMGLGEEQIELSVLRVLHSTVRSPTMLIRGDCLVHVVRTCYNVYLGGLNGTNQLCAKFVLT